MKKQTGLGGGGVVTACAVSSCHSVQHIHPVTYSHREMEGTRIKKRGNNKMDKRDDEVVFLRRQIGLLPAVSFIIGTVVGSGIFIAPKGVLMNSGSVGLSLLVWVLCGVLSLFGKMNDISADVCYCSLHLSVKYEKQCVL